MNLRSICLTGAKKSGQNWYILVYHLLLRYENAVITGVANTMPVSLFMKLLLGGGRVCPLYKKSIHWRIAKVTDLLRKSGRMLSINMCAEECIYVQFGCSCRHNFGQKCFRHFIVIYRISLPPKSEKKTVIFTDKKNFWFLLPSKEKNICLPQINVCWLVGEANIAVVRKFTFQPIFSFFLIDTPRTL